MALITSFASAGAGKQITYEITRRQDEADVSSQSGNFELDISDVREWVSLTENAAKEGANKANSGNVETGYNVNALDRIFYSKEINYSVSIDQKVVNSYILTRTITSRIKVMRTYAPYSYPTFTPNGGSGFTYPKTVTVTKPSGITSIYIVRFDLYGETVNMTQWSKTASYNVVLTTPSVLAAVSSTTTSGSANASIFA